MRLVRGTDVYSAQGDRLGTLSRVIIDPNNREVTHIVVEKGLLFPTNKVIPVTWISTIGEKEVYLSVKSGTLERIPAYHTTT